MIEAFIRAIGDLGHPAMGRIVLKAAALAILVLALLATGLWVALSSLPSFPPPWGWLSHFASVVGAILLAWLLFPIMMSIAIGLFEEDIAAIAERVHPLLHPDGSSHWTAVLARSLGLLLWGVILNMAALPLFFIAALLTPFYPIVFYVLNGYLLGQAYFTSVAARYIPLGQARRMGRRHWRQLTIAGTLITLLLTIPLVNIIAPVLATAAMVHLYARLGTGRGARDGR
ncbi:MAG TPA: EI24 domain-containing protein [Dongiaceae bacterium]|jgi:uncharacterized protein involved in cysteine biosynthesis|nr:EI24 domain-containing protein [Dongiaceae bacterium]